MLTHPLRLPSRFVLKGRVVPVDQHIGAPLRLTEDEEAAAVCVTLIHEHFRNQADWTSVARSVPETRRQPAREPARRFVRLPRQSVAPDEQRHSSSLAVAPPDCDPVDGHVPSRTRHGCHLARQVWRRRFVQPCFAKAALPPHQETRRYHVGHGTRRRRAAIIVARSVLGQEPCQDCKRSDRNGGAPDLARRGQEEAARGGDDAGWEGCTATRAKDGRIPREGDEWRGPCEGGTTEAPEGTVVQGGG